MTPTPYQEARERVAAIAAMPERELQDGNGDVHFGALVAASDLVALLAGPDREAIARVIVETATTQRDRIGFGAHVSNPHEIADRLALLIGGGGE